MQLTCATASRQEIRDGFAVEMSFCWLLLHSWRGWFTCIYLRKLKLNLSTYLHISSGMDCRAASSQCGYSYLRLLTPAFVTCSTNAKGWKLKMKYCCKARYGNPLLLCSLVEKCSMKFYTCMTKQYYHSTKLYQKYITQLSHLAPPLVQCTSSNTIATKPMIFSGIALYYGDTYHRVGRLYM